MREDSEDNITPLASSSEVSSTAHAPQALRSAGADTFLRRLSQNALFRYRIWLNSAHLRPTGVEVFLDEAQGIHSLVHLFVTLEVSSKLLIQFMLGLKPIIYAVSAIYCTVRLVNSVSAYLNLVQRRGVRSWMLIGIIFKNHPADINLIRPFGSWNHLGIHLLSFGCFLPL